MPVVRPEAYRDSVAWMAMYMTGVLKVSNMIWVILSLLALGPWQASVKNKFLHITELEAENHFWRRIMDGLPSGHLSFMLRAGSDTLPTPMNLQRYKIQVSSHCKLCQGPQATTGHILSACPEALEQGRYTWRHDFVLLSLVKSLEKVLPNVQIYADLVNMRAQEHPPATIPPSLSSTFSHPDIVCVNGPDITFLEVTVSGNSKDAMRQARERKQQKRPYLEITNDLHRQGLNAKYIRHH